MDETMPASRTFDEPATYRIVVRGVVPPNLSDRLEGMEISRSMRADGLEVSILVGELADQSALASVLSSLYELRKELVAVDQLPAIRLLNQSKPDNPEA